MTRPFNKKHFWLIVGVVAFLEVLIICLVLQWKYLFPSREVSELYARYADVDGVEASFIKDYKVNDSVFVDVTVLEASNDSAWAVLKKEYKIPELTSEEISNMEKGSSCIAFCSLPDMKKNDNNSESKYTNDNTLVMAMHNNKTIYVFYSQTRDHNDAIIDMFMDKYFLNKK